MGGGGGCCVANCCVGDCCIGNCGFCCIGDFFSCSDNGCCVGNCGDNSSSSSSSGSSSKTAKEDHAALIANEIAEMRTRSATEAKQQEEDIIKDVNETMEEFVKWIREINNQPIGGRNLNINIKQIEELNEALRKKIVGFIGKKLEDRLILTDPEVSTILAERDDTKRKKNFDDFYIARKRDAIRALIEEIETSVREQSDSIEREIQNRIKELDNNMKQEARAFDDLRKMKDEQDSRLSEKQIEYMYYENLCDIMFDELKMSSWNVGR